MFFMRDNRYRLLPTQGILEAQIQQSNKAKTVNRRLILAVVAVVATLTLTLNFVYLWGYHPRQALDPYADFISRLWPVGLPNRTDNWENENSKSMHKLLSCMAAQNCPQNATSIVLLSSGHFSQSIAGQTSGEDIWAMSMLAALREMGYTAIFSPDNHELARTYRQYPDLVKVVILEGSRAQECFEDARCIKTQTHPLGVPAWKLLSFHFWTGSANPLGTGWTLSPEDYAKIAPSTSENVYLGYSVERTCEKIPYTPISDRPYQAYILSKELNYFGEGFAWKNVSFIPPFPLSIISGIAHHGTKGPVSLPAGIKDLGRLNQTEFYAQLGKSRVLIGIGDPQLSPSPYDALCMGVPFINPVSDWDHYDPYNRTKWLTQHNGLKYEEPPYVYHVRRNDGDGLWDAVKAALEHPIEKYIVPAMTMDALKHRVGAIVERDWKSQAVALLEERKASGNGPLFEI